MKHSVSVVVGSSVAVMAMAMGLHSFGLSWWLFVLAANVAFSAVRTTR